MLELILAQASEPNIPFLDYINLGVLGVVFFAVIKGWIVTGREKDFIVDEKEKAYKDKKEAEQNLAEYQNRVQDEILPQLWTTAKVLERVITTLESIENQKKLE